MITEWLKKAIETSGLSQAEIARLMSERLGRSIERAAVNKMLKGPGPGGRQILADELIAISAITGIAPPLPPDGDNVKQSSTKNFATVSLNGYVQGGVWTDKPEWPQADWREMTIAPIDEYPDATLYACQVRGKSMNKVFPEGTLLIWVNIQDVGEIPISGKRYIVRRSRNDGQEFEMTVRTFIRNQSGEWLVSESDDPESQGAIKLTPSDRDQIEIIGRVIRSIREE